MDKLGWDKKDKESIAIAEVMLADAKAMKEKK